MSPFLQNFRDIMEHLDCLRKEITKYFPGINTDDALIALTRNPFMLCRDDSGGYPEFLKLVHDSFAKDEFPILSLSEFWPKRIWFIQSSVSELLNYCPFLINLSIVIFSSSLIDLYPDFLLITRTLLIAFHFLRLLQR